MNRLYIVLFVCSIGFSQSKRENLVMYINSKLDFFSGKTEIGFMRYSININEDNFINLKESWFINQINYKKRVKPRDGYVSFLPTHIKSIGITKDFNYIEFYLKQDYYRLKNSVQIKKFIISLEKAVNPELVAKERIRLKNSLVFMFRNLIKKKI